MSTNTTPAPSEKTKVNPAILSAVQALAKAETARDIAFDKVRNVAKTETVKHGYTDKQLTSLLLDAGLNPARASEVKGFVFPAHSAARKELDKAMELNAKQTDAKKRVAKEVILALQRDKEGTLTLETAQAAHKAKNTLTRTPGGETAQTAAKPAKAKTAEEIESELTALFATALKFAKANGYDEADSAAVMEEAAKEVFAEDADEDEKED